MIWRQNLRHSASLAESKTLEAHAYKLRVANLSIVPRTLGILTTTVTYCIILLEYVNVSQVNAQA